MDKKYTPGPWKAFYKNKYNEWHVSIPIDNSNMRWALFDDGIRSENPEADAKLIAAAPELLEAIEELLDLYMSMNNPTGPVTIKAMQAIEKAL